MGGMAAVGVGTLLYLRSVSKLVNSCHRVVSLWEALWIFWMMGMMQSKRGAKRQKKHQRKKKRQRSRRKSSKKGASAGLKLKVQLIWAACSFFALPWRHLMAA